MASKMQVCRDTREGNSRPGSRCEQCRPWSGLSAHASPASLESSAGPFGELWAGGQGGLLRGGLPGQRPSSGLLPLVLTLLSGSVVSFW